MSKVSNERKNLHRLAGEFLVASRLTQRGYMITLQWGNTISYDILAFDKQGHVAFLEIKSAAAHSRRWVLQRKYANPETDPIPLNKRFVCCIDLAFRHGEPKVYVFPAEIVAKGLCYYFNDSFPKSDTYHLSLDFRPQGHTKFQDVRTVGEFIQADTYLEKYDALGIVPIRC